MGVCVGGWVDEWMCGQRLILTSVSHLGAPVLDFEWVFPLGALLSRILMQVMKLVCGRTETHTKPIILTPLKIQYVCPNDVPAAQNKI